MDSRYLIIHLEVLIFLRTMKSWRGYKSILIRHYYHISTFEGRARGFCHIGTLMKGCPSDPNVFG
ncbi:unnamed protein product [Prunus brigantina]